MNEAPCHHCRLSYRTKLASPQRLVVSMAFCLGLIRGVLVAAETTPSEDRLAENLENGFRHPPKEARTRMFWRVFGPAWTEPEIDYQLGILRDAGVGGVMTFFMYPFAEESNSNHNQKYLSGEFLKTLRYAAEKAHSLDLRFGVAGGTGWPFGGPVVSKDDAAQGVWQEAVNEPSPGGGVRIPVRRSGEKILAVYAGSNRLSEASVSQLTNSPRSFIGENIRFIVSGPTRMEVKRPAYGAEGAVIDHFSWAATMRYLDTQVSPILKAAPGLVESVFCDSLEVYQGNWTGELPRYFRRARKYELSSRLGELFDTGSEGRAELHFDFWRTLSEMTEHEFTKTLSTWAHKRGVRLEMEAYGTPPNPLTAARYIDVPTGEQYEWKGFSLSRLAASGAHLAGRRVIGAEAWTWMGLPNRLGDSLSDTKLCSDLHYLAGINDLIGVDFAYSPRSAGQPGWLPYYGPVFNQNNPQWPWFGELVRYTSRCQWLLRQGKPVADVAVYLPVEDQFAYGSTEQQLLGFELRDHFVSGPKTDEFGLKTALKHRSDLIESLFVCGLNYDGIDFFAMDRIARVRQGHLRAGDGDYSLLVLPRLRGIEVKALEKIAEFCGSGGTVVASGRVPERTFGTRSPSSQRESRKLMTALFGEHPETSEGWSREYGRGRVIFAPDEAASLRRVLKGVVPDLLLEPVQTEVGFVHRRVGGLEIYFLANTSESECSFSASIVGKCKAVELWDALTGEIRTVDAKPASEGRSQVELHLAPRGSIFLVVGRAKAVPPTAVAPMRSEELEIPWQISFEGSGTNVPGERVGRNLVSWTEWADARHFSGSATYAGEFEWNQTGVRRVFLEFTEVREVAEVWINGARAGVAWTPPLEVELTRWLRPGANSLRLRVGNVPLNQFLGNPERDLTALRARYGNRFPDPEEKRLGLPPSKSGVIGPIRLRYVPE